MQAMIQTEYGTPDVLQFQETAKPVPAEDEVLIKVHAAAVNPADGHLLKGEPFLVRLGGGLRRPKHPIPGADMAGRVEAVGSAVKRFRPGDAVFGDLSGARRGAFAEYVTAPERALARKPSRASFAEAAAVPMAAVAALQGLRDHGQLQPGQTVLVNGASGGVGTFAVQIAKALGADVTAVCSTGKIEMVRAIGADRIIDYTQEDFTLGERSYDLIFDTVANRSVAEYRRALAPDGIFVTTGFLPGLVFGGAWRALTGRQKMVNMLAKPHEGDLAFLAELLEADKLTPVIDRCYPLADVPEALRYVETRRAKGKVVIAIDPQDQC